MKEKQHSKEDAEEKEGTTLLKIYVTTSNLPNAGTNANVFLQLFKAKKEVYFLLLKTEFLCSFLLLLTQNRFN